ncbi:MAG: hypothetical protein Kow002_08420 [Anaerolineales bacterium]
MFPYDLDLKWVLAIQSLGDWLSEPMKFLSFLGTEEFYILILPILYWCIDAAMGLRVGVVMLFSSGLNFILKVPFRGPRPYWLSADVKPLWAETSFGIPSGHAQNAVAVWGTAAGYFKRGWAWAVAVFLMLGIGISRVFLGAHFVQDMLLGWLVGLAVLTLFLRYWDAVAAWAKKQSTGMQILYAFLLSIGLVMIGAVVVSASSDFVMPEAWLQNASRIGDEEPAPVALSGILTSAGTLFGMLAGVAYLAPRGGWQVSGPVAKRALRYIVGLIGVLVIWYGLGAVFPRGESLLPYVLRFVRYALLGLWVSAGAPVVFMKLKLS